VPLKCDQRSQIAALVHLHQMHLSATGRTHHRNSSPSNIAKAFQYKKKRQIGSTIKVHAVARLTRERLPALVHNTLPLTHRHRPALIQMQC
jgi:hypothetical protein